MFLRPWAIAIAALVLSAGVNSSYAGSYDHHVRYPSGAFGQQAYFGTKGKHRHPAASGVACDRARDICYDRYGISYHATMRYLGEREANRAYKKYGDQVFLFSPTRGVVCDRRTSRCSTQRRANHGYGYQPWWGNSGAHSGWYGPNQQPHGHWRRD
ncbi:YcgJ family protein [Dongia deserti]|uniref:YcgJ family protein n=1 Tax=Dongia deserti TaxID=2268030 RepID=UPI000E65E80B|nr:YcgJ family protein [Dongia deserti]